MIHWIDPAVITCRVPVPQVFKRVLGGVETPETIVLGGDWDITNRHIFADDVLHGLVRDLVATGVPNLQSAYAYGKRLRKHGANRNAIGARKMIRLVASLKKHGYLEGKAVNDNIRVAVGRGGELLFLDGGTHRFAVACVLQIRVPVYIVGRHTEWEKVRQKLAEKGGVATTHPDLQDLIPQGGGQGATPQDSVYSLLAEMLDGTPFDMTEEM